MTSKLQELFRKHIEVWFGNTEIKEDYRPDWLNGLEIDLFLPEHGIAIECQGLQHKYYAPRYQASEKDFYRQHHRDVVKRRAIGDRGIIMIAAYSISELRRKLKKIERKANKRHRYPGFQIKSNPIPRALQVETDKYYRDIGKKKREEWELFNPKTGFKRVRF